MAHNLHTIIVSLMVEMFVGVTTADDVSCIKNTTCINHQVCGDYGCECPSSHYGRQCEYAITNALIIVLICTLPPISWIIVCCYGVHSRNVSKRLRMARDARNADGSESSSSNDVQEEVVDDHPPPTYAQVLHYDATGTYEGIELTIIHEGQSSNHGGSSEVEPPPSYAEWTRKAHSLQDQERSASGGSPNRREGIVTVSQTLAPSGETRSGDYGEGQGISNPAYTGLDEEQC